MCVSQHSTLSTDIFFGPTKHNCFQFSGLNDILAPKAQEPMLTSTLSAQVPVLDLLQPLSLDTTSFRQKLLCSQCLLYLSSVIILILCINFGRSW